MQKFLLILVLVVVLLYFLTKKVLQVGKSMAEQRQSKQGFLLIESGSRVINQTIRNTSISAGTGVVLLMITIFLAMKVKILLLLLPISLYLIAQLLLLNNHLKYAKDQVFWYNPQTDDVLVEWLSGKKLQFNLLRDIQAVHAVKSVQKNNQVQFGYYALTVHNNQIYIPFLLEENQVNQRFFKTIKDNYPFRPKTNLFPMI